MIKYKRVHVNNNIIIDMIKFYISFFFTLILTTICFAESRCITGKVADPKDNRLENATVMLKNNNDIKTQTDGLGQFKLCNVPQNDVLLVVKDGYVMDEIEAQGIDFEKYVDTKLHMDIRMDPWFLERDVTISAFFSDMPDCKIANAVMDVVPKIDKTHAHLLEGCAKNSYEIMTDENGNWHLDCFYPHIELGHARILPTNWTEAGSNEIYFQHPALFGHEQDKGTFGTDYTFIGLEPSNKDYNAKYALNGGDEVAIQISFLEEVLDRKVKKGTLTKEEAAWYWQQGLKNCPNHKKTKYDKIKPTEPKEKYTPQQREILTAQDIKDLENGTKTVRELAGLPNPSPDVNISNDNKINNTIDNLTITNNEQQPLNTTEYKTPDPIADAEETYQKAKDTEHTTANKMLSGLTMAATGIGGMELARGLAEQKADTDAERDMTAYMATFQCKIGNKTYSGGTTDIATSSENKLIKLYQEYIDLAKDLKERKEALGMKPGIESAVILDSSTTNLYDDKGTGIQNGTYASLYRAINGNETDKQKLKDEQNKSSNRVKGGAIATGTGAVGGAIGNNLINKKQQ